MAKASVTADSVAPVPSLAASQLAAALPASLAQPLIACLAQLQAEGAQRVAIGLSGGPDSVALAGATAILAPRHGLQVQAWHIHHGLMAQADAWQQAVQQLGAFLQIPVTIRAVHVPEPQQKRQGVEDAARQARYAAFAELTQGQRLAAADSTLESPHENLLQSPQEPQRDLRQEPEQDLQQRSQEQFQPESQGGALSHSSLLSQVCPHILLGQHLDDQAETVLFRLLRGSGPGGLAGMRLRTERGPLVLWRPWLTVPRSDLLPWANYVAEQAGISLADDPSNIDSRYARGALRLNILPAIGAVWPAYRQVLSRHAEQAAEMQEWLDDVVTDTLAGMSQNGVLQLPAWQALPPPRARLVLRGWLASLGHRPPTAARLAELERQLRQVAEDAQLRWRHDGRDFGVYRQGLYRLPADIHQQPQDLTQRWEREAAWPIWTSPRGTLHFEQVEQGICPEWLAAMPLRLSWQSEGGHLRLHTGGPARSVRNLFQEQGIPPWERQRRPRLWRGSQLLWVAGLGQSEDLPQASPGIRLSYVDCGMAD